MATLFWLLTIVMCAIGAYVYRHLGIPATVAWFAWNFAAATAWMQIAWHDVRTDGYVLQKRLAADGKKRWWVGKALGGKTVWTIPGKPG